MDSSRKLCEVPSVTPVAGQAGERLTGLLSWVTRTSDLYPVPDILTDEEKTQRGLCTLLVSLLSAAPLDATIGHTELQALPTLLLLMKTQRADPELQSIACSGLRSLGHASNNTAKQLARVGTIKTVLLTMRAHLKHEDVNASAVAILRSIAEASDGCRKLVSHPHLQINICSGYHSSADSE